MRFVVPGFEHHPGVHCGSTAMADALRVAGLPLTEEMAFGLGAGISFVAIDGPGLSPSTMFFGRSMTYEHDLCRITGVPFEDCAAPSFAEAWPALESLLRGGRPALLVTDVKYLPHYASSTHFNGHRVVLAGFDEERGAALIADTHFPGLCEVPLENLRAAMESDAPPVTVKDCSWAVLDKARPGVDLAAAARQAVREAAAAQLDDGGYVGVAGIERLARTIPRWAARADAGWCCRFGFQVIERRGTGGGLFRPLYARFLREAAEAHGAPELAALVPLADQAAAGWSRLAEELKALSEQRTSDFAAAGALAGEVATVERVLWNAAAAMPDLTAR